MKAGLACRETSEGTVVPLHVVPGASRRRMVGVHAGRLKIAVTEPPERGKANQAVLEFLAEELEFRKSQLSLVSGPNRKQKEILVAGVSREAFLLRLSSLFIQ